MYNRCKNCAFAKWIPLGQGSKYYNLRCEKMDKLVEYSILQTSNILDPSWCPTAFGQDVQGITHPIIGPVKPSTSNLVELRKAWDNIVPKIDWATIKKGNIYHVPPYLGSEKRFNIEIIFSCDQYFTYKKIGEYTSSYVYPNDLLYKVMVQLNKKS